MSLMGIEIERKFLVPGAYPAGDKQQIIKQGYVDPSLCSVHISDSSITISDQCNTEFFRLGAGSDSEDILKNIRHDDKNKILIDDKNIVRIRVKDAYGYITIKGLASILGTQEFEYGIHLVVANSLLDRCTKTYLDKIRHIVPFEGKTWEVDKFISPIKLVMAEVELLSPDEPITIPDWVGEEVTGNPKYFNSEIIKSVSH